MDFGVLGLEPEQQPRPPSSSSSVPPDSKQNISNLGSDSVWKPSKIPRTSGGGDEVVDFSAPNKAMSHPSLLRSTNSSADHNIMLSFSSSTPYYPSNPAYARASPGMHGAAFNGVRGPFTPSQWMELEHQALIYKYITANVAVPSNLLNPLKKSLYPFALSSSSAASFIPGSLGWGAFHLGYPGSTNDPEPGRCRRTDGKKWRCSRDAFGDQKYCERHINRGRHRSRKPVEGQSGHGVSGTKVVVPPPQQMAASTSAMTTKSAAASCIGIKVQHQPPAATNANRFVGSKVNDSSNGRMQVATTLMPVPKQNVQIQESHHSEFGLVSYDSLLNPSQHSSSGNCYSSFLNFSDQEAQDHSHSLHQFMDNDWPKDQSSRSVITWPEELKPDWTQLSMSIPMATSDFSSSSSSPAHDKLALSPLRLSREFDATYMGDVGEKQANWGAAIPWSTGAASMGCGPLGEVLTTSSNANVKSSSALNLLTEGCWDGRFSPTGVLQKATFASLSNSSSGSSPRGGGESKRNSSINGDDMLGSTIVSS
ncbi:Growth-regulating factor 1 [Linum perenne]